jgi:DNA-binding transcriptional ArsR family regulator
VAQALAQRRAGGAGRAGVKALVLQILSDGKPRTRREIERELRERFGVEAREKPLSGRLSELKRAGLVALEVREGVFYWRIAEGGGGR